MTRVLSVLASVLAVAAVTVGVAAAADYGQGYGNQDYGSGDRAGKKKGSGGQKKSSKAWRQYTDLEKTNAAHSAYLTGKALGGNGDPDARGSAIFHYVSPTTICYGFTLKAAGTPVDAVRIHKGKAGQSGDPVITFANLPKGKDGLANGNPGASAGCKDLPANEVAALAKIQAKPENYYVRMKTDEFQNGAVRGQLSQVRFDND